MDKDSTKHHPTPYRLTREQLRQDLREAYYDARRHKRQRPYQQRFEARLSENLEALCHELWTRTYRPRPSTCFIIRDPKVREVFAADFRDRIVHHLYFNYAHEMLERTFIQDSYSCIEGRGTHYGVRRLEHHIRQESQNYQERCYVLKLDIRGYFMHIDRHRLLDITLRQLRTMARHRVVRRAPTQWQERVDMEFLEYLTREIILLNPADGCRMLGHSSDWDDLPHDKSLFCSPEGCGLPIGNLTSQLFSNVYLGELDQWMKRAVRCRHYGRYVDDFYVVSADREWLHSLVPMVERYLREELALELQTGKVEVADARQGVKFLGFYVKPWRRYPSRNSLRRMTKKFEVLHALAADLLTDGEHIRSVLNSLLGVLSHTASYARRRRLLHRCPAFLRYGRYDLEFRHFMLHGGE